MKCGLLGKSLAHSYSPQIHSHLVDYSYEIFEKQPEELEDFLRYGDFTGINVTIPYKKDVIPYCKELTDCARRMGAVNTIVRCADGSLIGHNTDYFGFLSTVKQMGIPVAGKKVLVLGSGGASGTAVVVLQELDAEVIVISRSGENNYNNLQQHSDASVIVNTTPVGMYPNTGISPVNLNIFPHLEGVIDIIYNPARTQLILDAQKRGIPAQNGLWMLVAQAKEAAEWFAGTKIADSMIAEIHGKLRLQMENMVLIGMPGCGKSTIGRLVAQKLGKTFVDADAEIVNIAGMPIPQIFEQEGEPGFRVWETKVLADLGKRSGLVIATGGGCVTREENYPLLHQNSRIYWLQRDTSKLPTDGRPLSQTGHLEQMYAIRKPLYEKFADKIIANDSTPEDAVQEIMKGLLL